MVTIAVTKRAGLGRKACKALRCEGKIPAILYGQKKDVVPLLIAPEAFLPFLNKREHLVKLQIDGAEENAVIKEVQFNTFGDQVLHVDFCRIDMTKKIKLHVPIQFLGTPQGVQKGGSWEKSLRAIEISCLPTDIPEFIRINVEKLDVGEILRLKDVQFAESFTLEMPLDSVVTSIQAPKVEAPAPTEGAPSTAEPEVIKKAKTETEEA